MIRLNNIGFLPEQLEIIKTGIAKNRALIVVAGGTNSGKTNTVQAIINFLINHTKLKIIEVTENVEPIENACARVLVPKQSTLENLLPFVIGSKPSVLIVGELRTTRELQDAARLALMGNLVIGTFHANRTETALKRLLYLIKNSEWLAEALRLLIVQKLLPVKSRPDNKTFGKHQVIAEVLSLSEPTRDLRRFANVETLIKFVRENENFQEFPIVYQAHEKSGVVFTDQARNQVFDL